MEALRLPARERSIITHMDPRDSRGRNIDPFDAPDDYADPWRGRQRIWVLVGALAVIVVVILIIAFAV